MKIRIAANGLAAALAALLAFAGPGVAQQDTAQAAPAMRGRGMGMHGRGMGMGMMMQRRGMMGARGMGMGMRAFMRGEHIGPPILLGLKDELGLSDEQVSRLEKIRDAHRAQMKSQMEALRNHREAVRKARVEGDWDALEKAIDEGAKLRAGVAKGILNIERQSLDVLTDAQRQKFQTWQEGARLLRQQRLEHWRQMHGQGMRGQRMQGHGRMGPPNFR